MKAGSVEGARRVGHVNEQTGQRSPPGEIRSRLTGTAPKLTVRKGTQLPRNLMLCSLAGCMAHGDAPVGGHMGQGLRTYNDGVCKTSVQTPSALSRGSKQGPDFTRRGCLLPSLLCSTSPTFARVLLLAQLDIMPCIGRQDREGSPPPPPSPDDLEAGSAKYRRRGRKADGPGSRLVRVLRLGPGGIAWSAAWAAGGIAIGLLLSTIGSFAISRLASTVPVDAVLLPGQYADAHPGAVATTATKCIVRLEDADRALLRREMDSFARALCDSRPWLRAAADATPAEAQGGIVTAGQEATVQGLATVPRLVDEAFGRQSSSNVPGEDASTPCILHRDGLTASWSSGNTCPGCTNLGAPAVQLQLQL